LIEENKSGTALLRRWRDQPATVLSFLLVANNLVNILASSLATKLSLTFLGGSGVGEGTSLAIAIAVGVMTFLILVFGEVLPKTFARHNPKTIVPIMPLLLLLYYLLWPLARALGSMGQGFITLAGGDPKTPPPTVTEEELEYLIQRGTTEGSVDIEKGEILAGAFDLEDKIAKEVMVPRTDVVMFEARDPLPQVMDTIARHKFSRYPVYQESRDKVIGFFYVKDLLPYFQQQERGRRLFKLREFTRPPYYVPETMPLDTLLKEFREERIHIAVVVDEYGGTAGLVTLEDVIEELVGEIYDEYDQEQTLFTRIDDSTFVVHSRLPVEDVKEELGIDVEFPEDREYESIGGLVMDLAESVPGAGEIFLYHAPATKEEEASPGLRFTVLESDGVKLGKVKLEIVETEE